MSSRNIGTRIGAADCISVPAICDLGLNFNNKIASAADVYEDWLLSGGFLVETSNDRFRQWHLPRGSYVNYDVMFFSK